MISVPTADGSSTIYLKDIDEHYHSTFGAVTESKHIFIENGLIFKSRQSSDLCTVKIFEVGFGTGLNAVLTAMTGIKVEYHTVEKFPLTDKLIAQLDFKNRIDTGLLHDIHSAKWEEICKITDNFNLKKIKGDFLSLPVDTLYDVIYMDAFSPEKQPEMWSEKAIDKLSRMLTDGGVLTTYCAKGAIRRLFEKYGLKSERLPGPPGGKREILRLTKNATI